MVPEPRLSVPTKTPSSARVLGHMSPVLWINLTASRDGMLGLGFLGLSAPRWAVNIIFPLEHPESDGVEKSSSWRNPTCPVPGVAPPHFPAPLEHRDIWQEQADLMALVIKWGQLNEVAVEALPREIIPEGILLQKSALV